MTAGSSYLRHNGEIMATFNATPAFSYPTIGDPKASILVLCDAQNESAARRGLPLSTEDMQIFINLAKPLGFKDTDFYFVSLCPPFQLRDAKSAARKWEHVTQHAERVNQIIAECKPQVVVPFGQLATRVVMGKAMAVTKVSGQLQYKDGQRVFPLISPGFVKRLPEHMPTLSSDLNSLMKLLKSGWVPPAAAAVKYEWRTDISDIVARKPKWIGLDTETTGLVWWHDGVIPITVQIALNDGEAYAIPIDPVYWPELNDRTLFDKLKGQLKQLLEDPKVAKVGHNIKFDAMMLRKFGIEVQGWYHDTMLLWAFLNENAMRKDLASAIKEYVPAMAGYSDEFDKTVDKSKMREVPPDKLLPYACGDADAVLRLAKVLGPALKGVPAQWNCYRKIQFPALLSFLNVVEPYGIKIDQDHLTNFTTKIRGEAADLEKKLWEAVPRAIKRNYLRKATRENLSHAKVLKMFSLNRPDFIRDVLFTPEGFNLTPVTFTEGTADLEPDEQVASTSTKTHMPYFITNTGPAGQFCRDYVDYAKLSKLGDTYLGEAFQKYICEKDGCIHPFYKLHNTNTLRSASENPNGQNFPKRSRWAKEHSGLFVPRDGFTFVDCDLSQAELRIAAWEAMEPAMLEIYQSGGDIHTATAKVVMCISDADWDALPSDVKKLMRYRAKAVNFGFIYGMKAPTFRTYAKTDYNVDYTEKESYQVREAYFEKYAGLEGWHTRKKQFAHKNKCSIALHGAIRHLPSIDSTDNAIRALAERQAVNAPVQRFGSDLGLMALARFTAQADHNVFRIVAFIHDALIMECPIGMEEEGAAYLRWAMESNPLTDWFGITSPIPITAEPGIADPEHRNLGKMIERADIVGVKPGWWNDDEDDALSSLSNRLAL